MPDRSELSDQVPPGAMNARRLFPCRAEADPVTQLATCHLDANLLTLAAASPDAVARIRAATPRADMVFADTPDGVLTARIGSESEQRQLASRHRPLDEANTLVQQVDVKDAAVFVVAGFGMGYHVAALARKLGKTGIIMVYEPDVELLRAVLERVDHSSWLQDGNVCIMTDADDGAAMGEALRGVEGLVGLGVTLVQHPPSAPRLGESTRRFHERFTGVVEAVKMTVITTLVQVRVTMRNLMQNADVYVTNPGIAELKGACGGMPAIVVSAGPSLQRNLALLDDPAIRDRCVIVAVQTVLRTLLERGIKPHFVTALDYSEINRRFYEGLTGAEVEGITLVVEPKVNPSVLMAWPGRLRCTSDGMLDLLLGETLAGDHGQIPQGATVAHLAYYLARHLGCDPVALIGQDLGFTDGQYYSGGASIHGVWAGELNEFKSLELFEWQRIVRMAGHLRRVQDVLGREMFTDSQMHSYLAQFETDFRTDAARGLTTIDATEGGVRKQHTEPMTLRGFLDAHASIPGAATIDTLLARAAEKRAPLTGRQKEDALRTLRRRAIEVRSQMRRVADISARTAITLAEMREHHADRQRVDALITKAQASAAEVQAITPGFALTQIRGQATLFNRVRTDRMIELDRHIDATQRQTQQITRDLENVRGLRRAATEVGEMLDACVATLDGGPRITRDMPVNEDELARSARELIDDEIAPPTVVASIAVGAIVRVDLHSGSLGNRRSLAGPFARHRSVLAATIDRLLACSELRDIVLACDDVSATTDLLDPHQVRSGRVRVVAESHPVDGRRRRAISVGRLWSRACWRGGLADLTIFDEVFDPRTCLALMQQHATDATLLVGPDWCALDPTLCDEIIRRHRENPTGNRLTFSQAVPGLCGCVVSRDLVSDLNKGRDAQRMAIASIGGLLGYVPMAPLHDLIAQPICLALAGPVRDCGLRLIADTQSARELLEAALVQLGTKNTSAASLVATALDILARHPQPADELVVTHARVDIAKVLGNCAENTVVTLGDGQWDPLSNGDLLETITIARAAGAAGIHVRTRLMGASDALFRSLVSGNVDVLSIDCLDGAHRLTSIRPTLERLLALRHEALGDDGMGIPWIVPRLLRCDGSYELVEEFVNEWVSRCGWAALDPLPHARPGERIGPLPIPASAAQRFSRTRRFV